MLGPVALYVVAIHAQPTNAAVDPKKFSNEGRSMLYMIPIQRQGPQASELTEVESDNAGITVIKAKAVHLDDSGHHLRTGKGFAKFRAQHIN